MPETPSFAGGSERAERSVTVSQLTERIQSILEGGIPPLWVEGEISNFKPAASGHLYLSLKDEKSQIQAVMFRLHASALRFSVENGLKVLCFGQISVYGPRGQYQLKITHMKPLGVGDLQLAFEQLKNKLAAEGLFEQSRKRPLPFLPRRIGIVTSPTGAAIKDLITVMTRRFPNIEVVLAPVRVQGEGAAAEIASAIARLNELGAIDLLIAGRGGGSIEDLWAFNEEVVARAIAASRIPVVSAVGHEVDFTIADFVADVRAPTPSAAAEIVVPERKALDRDIHQTTQRLANSIERKLRIAKDAITRLSSRTLFVRPRQMVEAHSQRVDDLVATLCAGVRRIFTVKKTQFAATLNRIEPLSPLKTMARGYSVVTLKGANKPIVDASSVKPGDRIDIRFAQGHVTCRVEGTTQTPSKRESIPSPGQSRLPGF